MGRPTAQMMAVPDLRPLEEILVKKPGSPPLLMAVLVCCVREAAAEDEVFSRYRITLDPPLDTTRSAPSLPWKDERPHQQPPIP